MLLLTIVSRDCPFCFFVDFPFPFLRPVLVDPVHASGLPRCRISGKPLWTVPRTSTKVSTMIMSCSFLVLTSISTGEFVSRPVPVFSCPVFGVKHCSPGAKKEDKRRKRRKNQTSKKPQQEICQCFQQCFTSVFTSVFTTVFTGVLLVFLLGFYQCFYQCFYARPNPPFSVTWPNHPSYYPYGR